MKKISVVLAFLLSAMALPAQSDNLPPGPIRWIIGFAAGGNSDNSTRLVAKYFQEKLGHPVIIENRAGAGGIIAADYVAKSKPTGQTLLWGSSGALGAHKYLYKSLPFDPVTSFTYIHGFVSSPLILAVPVSSNVTSIADLVERSKRGPRLSYASIGAGTAQHLTTELILQYIGMEATHVPYKGSALGMTDLLAGRIDMMADFPSVIQPQIDAGKLRAIAQTGAERLAIYPDVPTFVELGYPEVKFTAWSILAGPSGMPREVVEKLASDFGESLKDPAVIKWHHEQGSKLMTDLKGETLVQFVISEQEKFRKLVERTGATAE